MKNYKAYRGDISIELSLDQDKTITIIHGEMGKGKTTLLGAIYWCLYGEERSVSDSDEGILNNDVLNNLRIGNGTEASVEISLYEQGEPRYKIKRSERFEKKTESAESRRRDPAVGRLPDGIEITKEVEYSELPPRSGGDDWMIYDDPERVQDKIENLFPQSLSSYFLFDAELLDKFFRADDERLVRNGIEKISGMPIIDNAIRHLGQSVNTIRRNITKVSLEPTQNKITFLENRRDDCSKKIDEAESKLEKIKKKIADVEHFLRSHSEVSISSIQSERDSISDHMKKIREGIERNRQDMIRALLSYSVTLQLKGVMESSIKQCESWEKEGKIPIAVNRHALDNMLRGKPPTCICGASLGEGSPGRYRIKELLGKNLAESPVIQSMSTGRGHWGDMVEYIGQTRSEIAKLRAGRSRLHSEYDEKNDQKKKLSKRLESHDSQEIRQKELDQQDLEKNRIELENKKAVAASTKDRTVRELVKWNQEYRDKVKRDQKHKSQSNQMELASTLSDLLTICRTELVEDMRSIVAEKTEKYFFKFVSRDDFARIDICPDYKTVVVGRDGKRKALSAGQTCCLALSYIASIRDIAEKNYFMVIDSPLHNISQAERVEIARNLPKFIPGTQITLLVQDQEYTGSAKEGIIGKDIQSVRKTLIDNGSLWQEYILRANKDPNNISDSTSIKTVEMR